MTIEEAKVARGPAARRAGRPGDTVEAVSVRGTGTAVERIAERLGSREPMPDQPQFCTSGAGKRGGHALAGADRTDMAHNGCLPLARASRSR